MEKATSISEDELVFHKRLVDRITKSREAELSARATLMSTILEIESAQKALTTWLDHLGEKYSLFPDDGIDAEGNIQYLDSRWPLIDGHKMMEEAAEEALAKEGIMEIPAEEVHYATPIVEDMVFEEGEAPFLEEDPVEAPPVVKEETPKHYRPSKKAKF
jgi:hypothetical protein